MTSWFVRFSISAISGMENASALPDLRRVRFGNLAQLGHRFTGQRFDLQPNLELALFRPKLTHLRPGITIDHPRKIKARRETESVLYAKKRRFSGIDR